MSDHAAFHTLPKHKFPVIMRAYPEQSTEDTDVVWEVRLHGPGAIHIPGFQETGQRVRIVISYGDGTEDRT